MKKKNQPGCKCCTPCVTYTICARFYGCNYPASFSVIEGASVTLTGPGGTQYGVTDATGAACFTVPSLGSYTLTPTAVPIGFDLPSPITFTTTRCDHSIGFRPNVSSGYRCCVSCQYPIPESMDLTTNLGAVTVTWDNTYNWWIGTIVLSGYASDGCDATCHSSGSADDVSVLFYVTCNVSKPRPHDPFLDLSILMRASDPYACLPIGDSCNVHACGPYYYAQTLGENAPGACDGSGTITFDLSTPSGTCPTPVTSVVANWP